MRLAELSAGLMLMLDVATLLVVFCSDSLAKGLMVLVAAGEAFGSDEGVAGVFGIFEVSLLDVEAEPASFSIRRRRIWK